MLFLFVVPLIVLKPRLVIYPLILMSMFSNTIKYSFSVGYTNIFLKDIILAYYFGSVLLILLLRLIKKETLFDNDPGTNSLLTAIFLYVLMHIFYMALGVFQGVPIDSILRRFEKFSGCLFFFFPLFYFSESGYMKRLLYFITILAVFFPVWQICIYFFSAEWQRVITSSGTVRLSGAGVTPLLACALFAILTWKTELKYYVLTVFPIISMVLVGHRSVLLALAMSLATYFIWTKKLVRSLLFVYFIGFALLIGLLMVELFTGHSFIEDTVTRGADTFNSENTTTVARIFSIKDNLHVFSKKPLTGIGYNHEALPELFPKKTLERERVSGDLPAVFNVLHPHNFVLRLLSHTGLLGTLLFMLIFFLVLKRCAFLIKARPETHLIGTFLFASIVFFIVLSLMNNTLFMEGHIFWILCGSTIAKYSPVRGEASDRRQENAMI